MLRNNNEKRSYYYEDCYMYFTFGDTHSSKYNLFIINNNDLKFINDISGSSAYASAMFQEGSYYLGTEKSQKTFKCKCAAEGLTLSQYKQMMKWLTKGTIGFLTFDSNPYWGWNTVLDQVGDATYVNRQGGLIVEFELTWKTIGSYLARNVYPAYLALDEVVTDLNHIPTCNGVYNSTMCCNEYGVPVIYYQKNDGDIIDYHIQSVCNQHQHFDYSFIKDNVQSGNGQFIIEYDGTQYINLTTKESVGPNAPIIDYIGEANLVLADNEIIELRDDVFISNFQPYGVLQLPADIPIAIDQTQFTIEKNSNSSYLMNIYDLNLCYALADGYNVICFTRKLLTGSKTYYGTSEWDKKSYPCSYESYLYFVDITDDTTQALDNFTSGWQAVINQSNINSVLNWIESAVIKSGVISSKPTLQFQLSSDTIPDNLKQDYKCYLVKSNKVSITCTKAKQNGQFISVVSCNNL